MIKKPLVSILIANYNNGNLVKKCVKSYKDQTYKNIEIMLIDDKSKDNSLKVISKLQGIKFIKTKKNKIKYKFSLDFFICNLINTFR